MPANDAEAPAWRIVPQPWMEEPPVRAVLAALGGAGRFVGGCVRDALLGRVIGDIDLATPLPPGEVMRRLAAAAIKAVPTGLAHGTVTAVVPPRRLEITTLRRDVETFGRHARVAFTVDWAEDAMRRDFTMNALFLDAEGNVFDPVHGLSDLQAGRVRFVGDAATRIREDLLRILRFYRFQAHYGRGEADRAARDACRALASLLPNLSGERVAGEFLKLLVAADPVPTLRLMQQDGVLGVLLPQARRLERLEGLIRLEEAPDAIRRLAALLAGDAASAAERLKLSAADRDRLLALEAAPPLDLAADDRTQRRLAWRFGAELYCDAVLLIAAEGGDAARVRHLLALAEACRTLRFPLQGRDVTALGLPAGPEIGRLLKEVEEWWIAGDFQADRRAALVELKRRAG